MAGFPQDSRYAGKVTAAGNDTATNKDLRSGADNSPRQCWSDPAYGQGRHRGTS